ncbi:hypothetical protein BHE74_00054875 [Ensete ventricosum]|nr:hypothetical protein BHE74_00054875 [Ensete ventricosum]
MWTAELAKLREKGRAAFSGSSRPKAAEMEGGSEPPLSQAIRIKHRPSLPLPPCTEAAVSMLVDCVDRTTADPSLPVSGRLPHVGGPIVRGRKDV